MNFLKLPLNNGFRMEWISHLTLRAKSCKVRQLMELSKCSCRYRYNDTSSSCPTNPQYLMHIIKLFQSPRELSMYDTVRKDYYWLHMVRNVYRPLIICHSRAGNGSLLEKGCSLLLFSTTRQLQIYFTYSLGPLPKTTKDSQPFVIITNR